MGFTVVNSYIKKMINIDQIKNELSKIKTEDELEKLRIKYLGGRGILQQEMKKLRDLPKDKRPQKGKELNELKKQIEELFSVSMYQCINTEIGKNDFSDRTRPGIKPKTGNLHLISQAIDEITEVFERIGFTRVRHPEIDSDYFAFEALNMPPNHPARDEWETFFVETNLVPAKAGNQILKNIDSRLRGNDKRESRNDEESGENGRIALTPHTSNGQVREMLKQKLPIRMINIAKCYRRQKDISHTPMFHQFEGLYVDRNVSINHLIGVIDFFGKQFFGSETKSRIRPFHFQFTEPSFEVDFSCAACAGKGCRLCKEGWLELGGAGMVHPNVLRAGGIDPTKYSGFAFGWGVERTFMIKTGCFDDLRSMYTTDIRVLKQF